MLQSAADQPEAGKWGSKVTLRQHDCSQAVALNEDGSMFDVVFAAKLLTHAPDRESMSLMYKTAAVNLNRGSYFVTLVSPVTEDPKSYFQKENTALKVSGLTVNKEFDSETADGVRYRMASCWPVNKSNSKDQAHYGYRLKKSVYEAAARDAGFSGSIEWATLQPPSRYYESECNLKIKKSVEWPDFSILILQK